MLLEELLVGVGPWREEGVGHGIAYGEIETVVGFGKVACREGVASGAAATGEDVWVGRGIGRRVSGHFLKGTAVDGAGTEFAVAPDVFVAMGQCPVALLFYKIRGKRRIRIVR